MSDPAAEIAAGVECVGIEEFSEMAAFWKPRIDGSVGGSGDHATPE